MKFYVAKNNERTEVSQDKMAQYVLEFIGKGGFAVDDTAKAVEAMGRIHNGEAVEIKDGIFAYMEEEQ